jgi:ubiquitin carboxyl-terminal hydrolase 10
MPAQLPSPLPPSDDSPAPHTLPELPEPATQVQTSSTLPPQDESATPLPPSSPPPPTPPPPTDEAVNSQLIVAPISEQDLSYTAPLDSEVISSTIVPRSTDPTYVIWSRKPRNPSKAAGVMISSRAVPPSHIVDGAANSRTPPPSPKSSHPTVSTASHVPVTTAATDSTKHVSQSSPESAGILSSSTTEATYGSTSPATPIPGTPATANTSVPSVVTSPAQHTKPLEAVGEDNQKTPPPHKSSSPVIKDTEPENPSVDIAAATKDATQASAPKAAVAAPKKSWASLLQPNDAASSSKSRLPTSAVVGFSIPAGIPVNTSTASSSSKAASGLVRPEVLNLLNSGPSGPTSAPKIRPRGLINTGNMCFANAVLQVLVYCPPFWRLFTELGKFVTENGSSPVSSAKTPLVGAIIQFLKEFGVKEADESKTTRSKGKEREDDFDDLDSFIPTYVYEVMKEKKRFASMVVCPDHYFNVNTDD